MRDDEYDDNEEFGDDDYFDDEAWDMVEQKLININNEIEHLEKVYVYWEIYRELKEDLLLQPVELQTLLEMIKYFESVEEYEVCAVLKMELEKNRVYDTRR